ncbi:MAG: hypothetical protein HY000_05930 [Planctomycetes bacterium]|nr:hypothetical protein [Planctomycetota bacterium]
MYGPFSVQSELIYSVVDQIGDDSLAFPGVYVYAAYFLTGERRNYRRTTGVFDRVRPKQDSSAWRRVTGFAAADPGRGSWWPGGPTSTSTTRTSTAASSTTSRWASTGI